MKSKVIIRLLLGAFCVAIFINAVKAQADSVNNQQPFVVRYLALGDSYTIGEGVAAEASYPHLLVKAIADRGFEAEAPTIIAKTGWTTTQLKDAIESKSLESNYDIASLLIGVNNQYQGKSIEQYEKDFQMLLNETINAVGGNPKRVFVLSIPDYGWTPFGKENQREISEQIAAYNAINKRIAAENGVMWFNITDLSKKGIEDASYLAPDELHPSGKMYREWINSVGKDVLDLLISR